MAMVFAANPHAVSSSAAMTPAWRNPEYWDMSVARNGIRSSHSPSPIRTTSNPAHSLKAAVEVRCAVLVEQAGSPVRRGDVIAVGRVHQRS